MAKEVGLHTQYTWAYNDLCEVIGLFYGQSHITEPDEQPLKITQDESGFELTENTTALSEPLTMPLLTGNFLEDKRQQKRALKNALYRLLKKHTGIHPPWGSLTGIRPTRLYYERLEQGDTPDKALDALEHNFDVTPQKAMLLREIAGMQQGLITPDPDEVDVYVGIPFCPTRCSYCSFASTDLKTGKRWIETYLDALCREITLCAEEMRRIGKRVRAMYMGGGTPTTLNSSQLQRLLTLMQKQFPGCRELTVEAGRPDTVDLEKLQVLRDMGVGRIAINPQTMNADTLARIGRIHSPEEVEKAYALARQVGFDSINMDLIAALPGEDMEDFAVTLRKVIDMEPENVTVHALAIKRTSALNQQGDYRHAAPEEAAQMVERAREMLHEAGLYPYYLYRQKYMAGNLENVGYAIKGKACLYNIDNMEETTPILAMGAGAISKWMYSAERRIERAPNVRNIEQYIERVDEMAQRKCALWTQVSAGEGEGQ